MLENRWMSIRSDSGIESVVFQRLIEFEVVTLIYFLLKVCFYTCGLLIEHNSFLIRIWHLISILTPNMMQNLALYGFRLLSELLLSIQKIRIRFYSLFWLHRHSFTALLHLLIFLLNLSFLLSSWENVILETSWKNVVVEQIIVCGLLVANHLCRFLKLLFFALIENIWSFHWYFVRVIIRFVENSS